MRYLFLILVVVQLSCSSGGGKNSVRYEVIGDWFIIYPDENLDSEEERQLYARIQDSIVNTKGVKLVSFLENGTFIQWDSTGQKGKWATMDEDKIVVNRGGRGFENFKTTYSGKEDGQLLLTETITGDGETIELVWHLKKITGGKFARLFEPSANEWRKVPAQPETDAQLRQRLSEMLAYYADYFYLIAEKSSYFVPARVMLPLRFYQHAIGMNEMDEMHRFVSLFSSFEEAKRAYNLLKAVINSAKFDLPEDDSNSYSKEYAQMLEILAVDMK